MVASLIASGTAVQPKRPVTRTWAPLGTQSPCGSSSFVHGLPWVTVRRVGQITGDRLPGDGDAVTEGHLQALIAPPHDALLRPPTTQRRRRLLS